MMISTVGNVGIGNLNPTNLLMVGNARCDGNTWISSSDRNLKENFSPIDPGQILTKVAALPLTQWNYKNDHVPHLGPVARISTPNSTSALTINPSPPSMKAAWRSRPSRA